MPGKVLLDTNVIIAFFSGEKKVSQHFADAEVFVSSIVLGELYYGARKSAHTAANLQRIEQFAAAVRVLSCDDVTAQHYGQIKDRLRTKGRPISGLLTTFAPNLASAPPACGGHLTSSRTYGEPPLYPVRLEPCRTA